MYTIKHAARLTGLSEATLRAWERRYGLVTPDRSASGYRLYDKDALARIIAARRLVDAGWAPGEAARAVVDGRVPTAEHPVDRQPVPTGPPSGAVAAERFLGASAAMDPRGIERALDVGWSQGSFEHMVDHWLCPTLVALGEAWAQGRVDVAGEHLASEAVRRRLAAAYDAAGSRARGPVVVVGLPAGSQHELGALAFATAAKRCGLQVLYLGADVPVESWVTATRDAASAVIAVQTDHDVARAQETADRLVRVRSDLLVATGGASRHHLRDRARVLPGSVAAAVQELDEVLHTERP